MKFDKETIIVLVLCGVLWFAWQPFCIWMGWIKKPEAVQPQQKPAPVQIVESVQTAAPAVSGKSGSAAPVVTRFITGRKIEIPLEMDKLPVRHLANEYFDMVLSPAYGEIREITFKKLLRTGSNDKLSVPGSFGDNIGMLGVFSGDTWRVQEILENKLEGDTYTLSRRISTASGKFIVTQTWKIAYEYGVEYHVKLHNEGSANLAFDSLNISGGVLEPFAIMGGDRIRNDDYILYFQTVDGDEHKIKVNAKDAKFFIKPEMKVKWIGLGTKYFMNVLVSEIPFNTIDQLRVHRTPTAEQAKGLGADTYYLVNVDGVYSDVAFTPGQVRDFNFKFYFGPKDKDMVSAFEPSATYISKLMSLPPMNALANFMLWSLSRLKDICGSYGWAIILLTAIVRILLWPITHKANMSMKRMQSFKPEMDEIRKKYKEDPRLMQIKMGELYKREGIQPMRGCLPLLLQLPIFMALYFALDGAMELRHVSFWWAADLSQPDTVANIFGLPLNPLVLVMTGLMLLQQRLMPQAGDATQQKLMMFMPLIMLFVLYNLPSGLTLYWTVSQVFSILQMLLTQKLAGKNNPEVPKAAKA